MPFSLKPLLSQAAKTGSFLEDMNAPNSPPELWSQLDALYSLGLNTQALKT
jgi:hypothetical protein